MPNSGPAGDAVPTIGRRWCARGAILALAAFVVVAVDVLLGSLGALIGGLAGIGAATAGAWWTVTRTGWRRVLGSLVAIGGLAVLVGSVLATWAAADHPVIRIGGALALFVAAVSLARAALVRDLHARERYPRWRPTHPVLICNPKSGSGKVERFSIVERARELGVEVLLLEPGTDLEQLARDAVARGADCLGMAGGDGSQALVASVAVEEGLPFVVICAGTRNHFALDLGLDRDDPAAGLAAFRDGVLRDVDYAVVGQRLFVNNVSLGVYASIVEEEGYRDSKIGTSLSRLPALIGEGSEPFDLQFVDPDGREVDGAALILVSNNPYVLGPALDLSQRRSLDTGMLGVFAVTAATANQAAGLLTRMTVGLGARDPNLHVFTAREFTVRSRGPAAWAGIDGESVQVPTPLHFAIRPRGLRLLVPARTIQSAERRRARGLRVRALWDVARGRPVR